MSAMPARLARRRLVLIFAGAFALVVVVAIVLAALLAPDPPKGPCPEDEPCGAPPSAPPLVNLKVWRSSELGFTLEYSDKYWDVQDEGPRGVRLGSTQGNYALVISGVPRAERDPQAAFDAALDDAKERVLAVAEDTEPAHKLLAPAIGIDSGVGGAYRGNLDTPQGTSVPVQLVLMAAGDPRVTISVTGATTDTDESSRGNFMSHADSVLNTVRLPGQVPR